MRPKTPPRGAPQGLRPVAKRVPTVQQGPCGRIQLAPWGLKIPLRSSPRKRGPSPGRWIPAFAGMSGVLCAADNDLRGPRTPPQIPHPRDVSSTNGKPPGGDPAAPVRRRSCRGAGSATAGVARYMATIDALRQGAPLVQPHFRCGAGHPSGTRVRHPACGVPNPRPGHLRPGD